MKFTIYIAVSTPSGFGRYGFYIKETNTSYYRRSKENSPSKLGIIAIIESVKTVKEGSVIEINTNNTYLENTINLWLSTWKKKGKDYENKKLWDEFYELTKLYDITARFAKQNKHILKLKKQLQYLSDKKQKEKFDYTVYTDGSIDVNPGGIGSYCAIILPGERTLTGIEENSTNNRMEIMAALDAVSYLPEGKSIEIVSDSQYVVNTINWWLDPWMSSGTIKEKANSDLWTEFYKFLSTKKVMARWVRGHSGDYYNELCDEIANQERVNYIERKIEEISNKMFVDN